VSSNNSHKGDFNAVHIHPDIVALYKFQGTKERFKTLVSKMKEKYADDPIMLFYIRAVQSTRLKRDRVWKTPGKNFMEPLCLEEMQENLNPFTSQCWRKIIHLVRKLLLNSMSGKWKCGTHALQPHQIVHYEAARMIALNPSTHTKRRRGLLITSNTGSGKTVSALGIMIAFWDKKLPNGARIPIHLVTTTDNQKNNTAETYAAYCFKYFPDHVFQVFEGVDFFPPRELWNDKAFTDRIPFDSPRGVMTMSDWCRDIGGIQMSERVIGLMYYGPGGLRDKRNTETFATFGGPDTDGGTKRGLEKMKSGALCIIDEAHNIFKPSPRNPAHELRAMGNMREKMGLPNYMQKSYCFLLTATPGSSASQVMGLLNLVRPAAQDVITAQHFIDNMHIIRGLLSYADIRGDTSVYGTMLKPVAFKRAMKPWYWFGYVLEGQYMQSIKIVSDIENLYREIEQMEASLEVHQRTLKNLRLDYKKIVLILKNMPTIPQNKNTKKFKANEKELSNKINSENKIEEKKKKELEDKKKALKAKITTFRSSEYNLNRNPGRSTKFFIKDIENGCFLRGGLFDGIGGKLTEVEKAEVQNMTVQKAGNTVVLSEKMKTLVTNTKKVNGCQYIYVMTDAIRKVLIEYMVSKRGYELAPSDATDFQTERLRVVSVGDDSNAEKFFKTNKNSRGTYISVAVGTKSEGLDLKYLRAIHLATPLPTLDDDDQAVGRGLRMCAHNSLNAKTVALYRYYSIPPYTRNVNNNTNNMKNLANRFVKGKKTIKPDAKRIKYDKHLALLTAIHQEGWNRHVREDAFRRGNRMKKFMECVRSQSIECEINSDNGGLLAAVQLTPVACGGKKCDIKLNSRGELIIPRRPKNALQEKVRALRADIAKLLQ